MSCWQHEVLGPLLCGYLLADMFGFGKDSKRRSKATRSEGDDLGDSAAHALMRHGGGSTWWNDDRRGGERRVYY